MILRALRYYFCQRHIVRADGAAPETTPASGVDMQRYMGRWYELARFETPFEFGLDEVWTTYDWLKNGQIEVINYGMDATGKQYRARARAVLVSDGVLLLSFVPLLRFLSTPYHILKVDAEYANALVSNEDGSCLWLLSRHADATLAELLPLLQEALRRGFDIMQLRPTHQSGPFNLMPDSTNLYFLTKKACQDRE